MTDTSVFISYSHDSDVHRARVFSLSEKLRSDGLQPVLDRYVEEGSPAEGWPRWMMNGLNGAASILCICTEVYLRRFLGHELPGKGRGSDWEGALVTQALYDARSRTNKFIPVLFEGADEVNIPAPLRSQTHYVLSAPGQYEALRDRLLRRKTFEPSQARPGSSSFQSTPPVPGDATSGAKPLATPPRRSALGVWREKLEFLLVEDAICADPAVKFRLQHLIEEAQTKIRALEAGT